MENWGAEMAKVTIEDISRYTGLSRGTVSRALNDRPDISEQTKQRVLEACTKLNYRPSAAARSLATGRSLAIAVLVTDMQAVFAGEFVRGALASADAAHYVVHIAEIGTEPEQQKKAIEATVSGRIDGVLLEAVVLAERAALLREALEERPLVACLPVPGLSCDILSPDQAESGRLVARHLLRNNERAVLYVHRHNLAHDERLAGFQEICRERGLDSEALTLRLAAGPLSDQNANLIRERLADVQAIATSDDFLALDIMGLCWQAGRAPGCDIAIVGQGNERFTSRIRPTLSSVDLRGEEIGRRAMDTALQRLAHTRMDAPQAARVAPVLVPRDSTRLLG